MIDLDSFGTVNLAISAATFAGFGGGVEIAQGTLGYIGATFACPLSGSGILAVSLGAKEDGFAFRCGGGQRITGTLAFERGTLVLDSAENAANNAALGGVAALTLTDGASVTAAFAQEFTEFN